MNNDFATAMRRSLALTRAGNLTAATQQIQEALGGAAAASAPHPAAAKRKGLAETLRDLQKQRGSKAATAHNAARAAPVPEGARFETRQFDGPQGGRMYRLYVPSCGQSELRGMVMMLHGCTQSAADFATGTAMNAQAEAHNFLVAYPEQTSAHNPNLCWNWFEPQHQTATGGEPAILADLAQTLGTEFALPEQATFAAGLSAGGAMAALLGSLRSDVFAAVGVHSGLAPLAARDMMSAFAAMQGRGAGGGRALTCPAIILHGLADNTVAPVNASSLAGTITLAERSSFSKDGRKVQLTKGETADGNAIELWLLEGAGHTWSGGSPAGSHTDAAGPDASAEMIRFFNEQIERD